MQTHLSTITIVLKVEEQLVQTNKFYQYIIFTKS